MTRNIAYDGLRGWLLIIIACNHLYGSFVSQITREPFGFVSAAEGFLFLSGFVAYLVYSRLASEPKALKRKVWKRSLTIYSFHIIGITLTFSLIALFPFHIAVWSDFFNAANWFNSPLQTSISALFLLEQPGYFDILILYLIPMAFLPFAILAIKKGQGLQIAIISFTVWFLAKYISIQTFVPLFKQVFPDIEINVSAFDPFAWQLYFYMGVLISYLKFDKLYQFNFPLTIQIGLLVSLLLLFILKHWPTIWIDGYNYGYESVSILRQLNLLLLVYAFMLGMRYVPWIFKLKYPVFLGQHALAVFTFHGIVVYFLLPTTQPFTTISWYWDVLACLFFVALLWIPATLDRLYHRKKSQVATEQVQL